MTLKVEVALKSGVQTFLLKQFIKKGDVPGKARCTICEKDINYATRGSIALLDHARAQSHIGKVKDAVTTPSIKSMFRPPPNPSVGQRNAPNETPAQPSIQDSVKLPVPVFDRVSNAEVCILLHLEKGYIHVDFNLLSW